MSRLDTLTKILVAFLGLGLGMGLVFPVYANFFVEWHEGMFVWFALGCLIAGLMVGLGNWWVAKSIVIGPINRIAEETRPLAEGDLSLRLTHTGSDEIGRMATAINDMLDAITTPVRELSDRARRIAEGDLTVDADIEAVGDFVPLVESFQDMTEGLRGFVLLMSQNIHTVTEAAATLGVSVEGARSEGQRVLAATCSMAEASAELAQMAEASAATVHSFSTSLRSVSDNALSSADGARDASDTARSGMAASSAAAEVMQRISAGTERASLHIAVLQERTQEIDKVLRVIQGVADQTNLLALNATIEAVNAGEAGAGFGVVAEEIRTLAARTKEATAQIRAMVTAVQEQTQAVVTDTQEIDTTVSVQGGTVHDALAALESIGLSVQGVIAQSGDVTMALAASTADIEEFEEHIATVSATATEYEAITHEVSTSTEVAAASLEAIGAAAERLAGLADELRANSSRYRLPQCDEAVDGSTVDFARR